MKRFFKKLLFKDNGAVSIFAIMIVLPIFLVNALFIDTARIILAERQIENALDTAIRSTMANFNEKLASVGLFSYQGTESEAQSDFESYVQKQGFTDQNDSFSMARPKIESAEASFDTGRNLVDIDVFEYQVLESMKYQAPAQIGIEIFDLITKSNFGQIDEDDIDNVEKLGELYEELFELVKKRNNKIQEAETYIKKYIERIEEYGHIHTIIGPSNLEHKDKIPENISHMKAFILYHDRYRDLKEEIEDNEDDDLEDEMEEIDNYEDGVFEQQDSVLGHFIPFTTAKDNIKSALFGSSNWGHPGNFGPGSAMDYHDQVKEILDEINSIDVDLEGDEGTNLKKLDLENDFFEDIYEIIQDLDEQFDPDQTLLEKNEILQNGISSSTTVVQLVDGFYKVIEEDKNLAIQIKDELEAKYEQYRDQERVTLEERLDEYRESKEILKDQDEGLEKEEEKGEAQFDELWDLITASGDFADDQDVYDELEDIIRKYDAVTGKEEKELGKWAFIKEAYNTFKSFLTFVKDFPGSFRNELYINEYIMANYGMDSPYSLLKSESYKYENKQALFITYGYTTPGQNYIKFLLDIAMVVFVAELLDLVIFRGGFAGPLGFLRAITQALAEAASAITQLTNEDNQIYVWKPFRYGSAEIEMSLPMFLRIFMITKSLGGDKYNDKKKRRLQAAITYDTGVELDNSPSYIEGEVEGKVELLFIPPLAKLLPNSKSRLLGNEYIIKKSKVYSY